MLNTVWVRCYSPGFVRRRAISFQSSATFYTVSIGLLNTFWDLHWYLQYVRHGKMHNLNEHAVLLVLPCLLFVALGWRKEGCITSVIGSSCEFLWNKMSAKCYRLPPLINILFQQAFQVNQCFIVQNKLYIYYILPTGMVTAEGLFNSLTKAHCDGDYCWWR